MKTLTTCFLCLLTNLVLSQIYTGELHQAMKADNPDALFQILDASQLENCFEIKGSSYTILSISVKYDRKIIMQNLLDKQVDIDKICAGKSALMYAAKYGNIEALKVLLKHGANLNHPNQTMTVLDYAIKYQQTEIVDYLNNL